MKEESLHRMERYGSTTKAVEISEEIARRVDRLRAEKDSEFNQGGIKALQDLFDHIHHG